MAGWLRSACHDAAESQAGWAEQTQVLTRHAPGRELAQLGHVATEVLRAVFPITRLMAGSSTCAAAA
jgi:hypothetical protein